MNHFSLPGAAVSAWCSGSPGSIRPRLEAPGTNDEADVPLLVSKKCLAEYLAAVDLAVGPLEEDQGTSSPEPEAAEEGAHTPARPGYG